MKRRYSAAWLALLGCAFACAAWVSRGRAYVRRNAFAAPVIADASRTESQFVAVLLPRITERGERYAMSAADLKTILKGLQDDGCVPIGFSDVEALYARGRKLPPKAVLFAFADDGPRAAELADQALKRLRLRGTEFLLRTAGSDDGAQRRFLTGHAVDQMRRGGAWEFGLVSQETPPTVPEAGRIVALLDDDGHRPAPKRPDSYPLRFVASEMGLNDLGGDPRALRILALKPERAPGENLSVVRNSWPRTAEFVDEFQDGGLGADWVSGWGIVSKGRRRLVLLPTPRQSGAGVFLRGTEQWRDVTLEFELTRYQKEFWAYARYKDDGRFIRIGARGGSWFVEQKTGPKNLPSLLARAPMLDDALPARVRLILKDGAAIVQVNGRMQFGRPLRVNPAVDRGRIVFGVYDARTRGALAVLGSVRAAPLGDRWIAPRRGAVRGFEEDRLEGLRAEAVSARAFSPRWVSVASDGAVAVAETQGVLVRSLAGFYGCRLVPMAEFPAFGPSLFADPAESEKIQAGLIEAARGLEASGLNLRLRGPEARRPATIAFLSKLRAAFRARRWELWVTVEGPTAPAPELTAAVDGVLTPGAGNSPDLEILTAGRAQRETASIQ